MASHQAADNALHSNFDVDYVISYRFTDIGMLLPFPFEPSPRQRSADKSEAIANFQKLIRALAGVGLETEVRNGDNCSVLVFVKAASEKRFNNVVYRSR